MLVPPQFLGSTAFPKHISSARVNDGPTSQTSFGDGTKLPCFPICRDDGLADEGAKAPKPCLSPGEIVIVVVYRTLN